MRVKSRGGDVGGGNHARFCFLFAAGRFPFRLPRMHALDLRARDAGGRGWGGGWGPLRSGGPDRRHRLPPARAGPDRSFSFEYWTSENLQSGCVLGGLGSLHQHVKIDQWINT
ncbi:hypothetical protein [Oryza sativa Japonica Group]|uniref:Uncharacterized protein n=1 Tax=Oryza sativa subsp. japonica TaxID=39947 RepID=Q5QNF1_ORYSJ|nr:hypothetical protein [Oryza sativa Japonica Group]